MLNIIQRFIVQSIGTLELDRHFADHAKRPLTFLIFKIVRMRPVEAAVAYPEYSGATQE
ncbi:hypothetical protein [Bradyrhizobium sp. AZCC 1693]|uniref:hypothetical protein n=1 Tax=Bradyrhizobium sp. AZCC 1693 TaxID=3117029 RepID=UPI002FF28E88